MQRWRWGQRVSIPHHQKNQDKGKERFVSILKLITANKNREITGRNKKI